jgi:hypothetical protein
VTLLQEVKMGGVIGSVMVLFWIMPGFYRSVSGPMEKVL